MNERVLSPQLLKLVQAAGPGYSQADPEWVKKFAELIVNDVLNIVAISGEQCNCSTLFRKISEHFGVNK